jgi:hypothetical protein
LVLKQEQVLQFEYPVVETFSIQMSEDSFPVEKGRVMLEGLFRLLWMGADVLKRRWSFAEAKTKFAHRPSRSICFRLTK